MDSLPFFAVPLGAALLFLFIRYAVSETSDGFLRSAHVRVRAWWTGQHPEEVKWALDERDTAAAQAAAKREKDAQETLAARVNVDDDTEVVEDSSASDKVKEVAERLGFDYSMFATRFPAVSEHSQQ